MFTDKGPQRQWLREMDKTNERALVCVRWMDATERSPGRKIEGAGETGCEVVCGVGAVRSLNVQLYKCRERGGQGLAREGSS